MCQLDSICNKKELNLTFGTIYVWKIVKKNTITSPINITLFARIMQIIRHLRNKYLFNLNQQVTWLKLVTIIYFILGEIGNKS